MVSDATEPKGALSLSLLVDPLAIGGPLSLRLRTPFRLPRRVDQAFDTFLVGEGWHGCEFADTVPFRWMGREDSAAIWLAVDRSVDIAVDIGILFVINPAFEDQITVEVGEPGEPLFCERTPEGLSFILPKMQSGASPTKISLRAPAMIKQPDTRRLSIACSYIRTRPLDNNLSNSARVTLTMALSKRIEQSVAVETLLAGQGDRGSRDVG